MRGITVGLHVRTQTGEDALNNPIYSSIVENVANVLVGEPTTDDITSSINLYGKRIQYMLGIPKGDTHNWKDTEVDIFGRTFRTFGDTIEGIEANIPTPWHKKVRVERCE
jgi:hypothetical protein